MEKKEKKVRVGYPIPSLRWGKEYVGVGVQIFSV